MRMLNVLLMLMLPLVVVAQESWQTVGGTAVNFEIDLFGETNKSVNTFILEQDTIKEISWESNPVDSTNGNSYYAVSTTGYPASFIHSDSSFALIEGFLNSTVNELSEEKDYELLSSSIDLINGYPGKIFKYKSLETGMAIEIHSYLIQDQLLVLSLVTKPNDWFNKSIDRYFSSLELLNRPENNLDYGFTLIKIPTYEIAFPDTTAYEQNLFIDSQVGRLNLRMQILERKIQVGNMVFIAGETKYPASFQISKEELPEFYASSIEGSLKSTNATLLKKNDIVLGDYPGVEFYGGLFEGQALSIYRIFLIEGTLYNLGVITTKEQLDQEAEMFFDSFKRK